jgi:NAD(P)-dependent dehydrogenase (short-subunit alcohol dehydrogenase family)
LFVTGSLTGRTIIVTGAGRGIGREHALLFAAEGAQVVVNDLGVASDGSGAAQGPASDVADEIARAGGTAIASTHDIADWAQAEDLVSTAVKEFGQLDVVVNNAGILRDRTIANLDEGEWDAVIRVHLRGHAAVTRWAAAHWRDRARAGGPIRASLINTTSTSGLFGHVGQANYGAAKAGIASFTLTAHAELLRYGVRCNAVAPAARTRLTEQAFSTAVATDGFDAADPANISPFLAYLATEDCPLAGRVFFVYGGRVDLMRPWSSAASIDAGRRWTVAGLREAAGILADANVDSGVEL